MRTKVKIITMYFIALLRYNAIKKRKLRKLPRYRVNPYLEKRRLKGRFLKDFEDLKKHKTAFNENFHMDVNIFENLFSRVEKHLICKKKRTRKDVISPKEKFVSVIEFLASGTLQRHIASLYRISKQRFGNIIDSVCDAIIKELKTEIPEMNEQSFARIADGFTKKWNFPNCLRAIDGKHVAIKATPKSGSLFYNYKGFFSLVCMAISDAEYKFTYLDIGAFGSEGDSNILLSSDFGKQLLNDSLHFPPNNVLDGEELPFYFIGDGAAFPLGKRIIKTQKLN